MCLPPTYTCAHTRDLSECVPFFSTSWKDLLLASPFWHSTIMVASPVISYSWFDHTNLMIFNMYIPQSSQLKTNLCWTRFRDITEHISDYLPMWEFLETELSLRTPVWSQHVLLVAERCKPTPLLSHQLYTFSLFQNNQFISIILLKNLHFLASGLERPFILGLLISAYIFFCEVVLCT